MYTIQAVLPIAVLAVSPSVYCQQGSIVSWGHNTYGTLISDTPQEDDFVQVEAGLTHSVAVNADGFIFSWGSDHWRQVSDTPTGPTFSRVVGSEMGSLALRDDGSLVAWGDDGFGQVSNTPTGVGFVDSRVGLQHYLVLKSDGSLVSWGRDAFGQVSNTPAGTGYVQIASGDEHSLAVRPDGSIAAWGSDIAGQVSSSPAGAGFIEVAGGRSHSLALRSDGSLISWGDDSFGQVSGTPTAGMYIQIACGRDRSLAILDDGSIVTWGTVDHGLDVPPPGLGFMRVAGGWRHSISLFVADNDADADNDGLVDAEEISTFGTDPLQFDTDADGLCDGQELGVTYATAPVETNQAIFVEDTDPLTTTDPLLYDTDGGGTSDGNEDVDKNGALDVDEHDPNNSLDDLFQLSVVGLSPGQQATLSVSGCRPGSVVIPLLSTAGFGSRLFPTYSQLELSLQNPITQLPGITVNGGGTASTFIGVPPNVSIGLTVYWQAIEITGGGDAYRPSIPIFAVVQ